MSEMLKGETIMSFRSVVEQSDKQIREELGEYYYISKSRIENLLICVEGGAARIQALTQIVSEQQQEIKRLINEIGAKD
jgi:hypothetical protein